MLRSAMNPWIDAASLTDLAVHREVFFLEYAASSLFVSFYAADPPHASFGAVIAPSWSYEADVRLDLAHAVAADIATLGGSAMLFHPPGHGDSSGDASSITLPDMCAAIAAVTTELRNRAAPDRVALVGIRLGAWFVAHAAQDVQPDALALIQPVQGPAPFFEEIDAWSRRGAALQTRDAEIPQGVAPHDRLVGADLAEVLATFNGPSRTVRYARPGSDAAPLAGTITIPGDWRLPTRYDGSALARTAADAVLEMVT